MTKIDLNLSKKPSDEVQTVDEVDSTKQVDSPTSPSSPGTTPIIKVGGVDLVEGLGSSTGQYQKMPSDHDPLEFFNWGALQRVSLWQMVLSAIAMFCVLTSLTGAGFTAYRFSQFFLAAFMFRNGHAGYKAAKKSYWHLIFFTVMIALQWLICVLVLFCLAYTMCEAAYYLRYQRTAYDYDSYGPYGFSVIMAEIFGTGAMIGTIITGCLGLSISCRGFANMLAYQEKFFKSNRQAFETA